MQVTNETREKMRKSHLGKTHTEETKQLLRLIALARPPMSAAIRKKISKALLGHTVSAKTREKIRQSLLRYNKEAVVAAKKRHEGKMRMAGEESY